MADRRVIAVHRDGRGITASLCNSGEPWSPVSAATAIGHISSGLHSYYTGAPDSRRYLQIVNGPRESYLRSAHDAESENNLENLPTCDGANAVTGLFDVLVEFSEVAINSVTGAMHAVGVIPHQASVIVEGYVVMLVLGAHAIRLEPADAGTPKAVATVPVSFWLRRLDRLDDPGSTGVGTVRARVACYSVVEADGSLSLATDWSETAPGDIAVTATVPEEQGIVGKALLVWAQSAGGRFRLPAAGALGAPVNAALRFADTAAGMVAQCGLNLNLPAAELFPAPSGSAIRLVLSRKWIVSRILAALSEQFGGLPRPHGETDVPIAGAAALTALDVELGNDQVLIYGGMRVGITSAKFTVTIGVSGTTPQNLRATVRDVQVDVDDLLSSIADFFAGGAVKAAITAGIRSALRGGGKGGITEMLDKQVVRSVLALGSAVAVGIDVDIDEMKLTSSGAAFTGDLVVSPPPAVRAKLRVQALPERWCVLSALESWTPGDSVKTVTYEFGDGTSATTQGGHVSLVATHQYAVGRWRAAVTVTDRAGRTSRTERSINVR